MALVQVGVPGEQTVCGAQGDSDHPPTPNHVLGVRGGASVWACALDSQIVGTEPEAVGYLHPEEDE